MTVYSVGAPVNTHSATGSVTGTWGGQQFRVAGHLLVAVVSCAASTSVTATATVSGWVNQFEQPNTATAQVRVAIWTKVAVGGDTAPTFTSTETGTAGGMDCMLFELSGANTTTPIDVSAVYASGASAGTVSMTATTGVLTSNGECAIACFAQERAAGVLTWTDTGTGVFSRLLNGNGASSVLQTYIGVVNPNATTALNDAGSFSTNTTAFGAGVVAVFAPAPVVPAVNMAFTNNGAGTVTTGGTTAPAGGTVEAWTVTVTGAFPVASAAAQPPVQFTVCDVALPLEKFLVTAAPGGTGVGQSWTVTRGAEGTAPVAHTAGFTIVEVTTAGFLTGVSKELSATAYVDCDYAGVVDASTAFNAALATLPVVNGYPVGRVVFGPGVVKMAVTPSNPGPSVFVQGAGRWATTIYSYVPAGGDCFRIFDPSGIGANNTNNGGGITGMTIRGDNAGAGSCGLHIGDVTGYEVDCIVLNFQGAGSKGVWFDNEYRWTECLQGSLYISGCTVCCVFDNPASAASTSTGSFSRMDLKFILEQGVDGTGQVWGDGVVFQNGALCFDGSLEIRGNYALSAAATSAAVLRLTGSTPAGHAITSTSQLALCRLLIGVELNHSGANTFAPMSIFSDGTAFITSCFGILDFGADQPFAASNIGRQLNQGFFTVNGDAALGASLRANLKGPLIYATGFGDGSTGSIQTSQGDFFNFTLTANVTIALNTPPAFPQRFTFIITQDGTGGRTVTWPVNGSPTTASPNVAWPGGMPPQMSASPGATDIYLLETYDGARWYGFPMVQQGVVDDTEQFVALTGTRTLVNNASAQAIFNATTNGALTVAAATSYFFECEFDLTGLSASAHTLSFGFGGTATYTSARWKADTGTGAAGTPVAWLSSVFNVATASVITASATTTTAQARIAGIVRVNAAGTLIPQITQTTNTTAAIIGVNSWFRITPAGSNVVTNVGNWT